MTKRNIFRDRASARKQSGFTLIEVLISTVVLTVGLVTLLGVFGYAVATAQTSQLDLIAKMLADEAMESIFNARDTSQNTTNSGQILDTWTNIQNTSNGGIFLDNFQPIKMSGNDGLVGTVNDQTDPACNGAYRCLTTPGKDGILGTADDVKIPLGNFQRQIQIAPLGNRGDLKTVTITIRYTVPGLMKTKQYVLSANISQYR